MVIQAPLSERAACWRPDSVLTVQSVLYGTLPDGLEKALENLDLSAREAIENGLFRAVKVAYGDGSPTPVLDDATLESWRNRFENLSAIDYVFFGKNLGSARGHNTLVTGHHQAPLARGDGFMMVMNPDVIVAHDALTNLAIRLKTPGIGLVEARQMPIEHPKDYDRRSGDTVWASTACVMLDERVFHQIGGFDADTFFLYCDDVDFSWRMRLAGWRVVFEPSAVAFHDKRLSPNGAWMTSAAERYYSAEAALLLAHKYSRPELVKDILRYFRDSKQDDLLRAAKEFERRRAAGLLPLPLDGDHKVAVFEGGEYAPHRFRL
ncbi:MAG: glycosyltransferase family 2 protein [bacterium]|nr:glycosyltransferase family 2 protein [bacterium]